MRAVDYVTNGFGGVVDDIIRLSVPVPPPSISVPVPPPSISVPVANLPLFNSGPSGASGLQFAPVETKIRALLESSRFPQYIVEAAVQTYRTRGVAGLIQAKNFGEALGPAFQAAMRLAKQQAERTGYANLGALYRNVITGALNTAASRTGTNPLINSMRTFYTSAASSIPNSSRDPEGYMFNIIRKTPELGPVFLNRLIGIAQGVF